MSGPVYASKRPKTTIYASQGRLVPRGGGARPVGEPAYVPIQAPPVHGHARRPVPVGARPDLPWFPTASFVRARNGQVRGLWRTFVFGASLSAGVLAAHLAYYL